MSLVLYSFLYLQFTTNFTELQKNGKITFWMRRGAKLLLGRTCYCPPLLSSVINLSFFFLAIAMGAGLELCISHGRRSDTARQTRQYRRCLLLPWAPLQEAPVTRQQKQRDREREKKTKTWADGVQKGMSRVAFCSRPAEGRGRTKNNMINTTM